MNLLFLSSAGAMVIVALAVIALPLWRGAGRGGGRSHEDVDVGLYRRRRAELERERDAGLLSDDDYQRALAELDRQLLAETGGASERTQAAAGRGPSRWPVAVAAIALPAAAVCLYTVIGGPDAVFASGDTQTAEQQRIEAMVPRLEERVENNPDDGRGWLMLGRAYLVSQQPQEAVEAFSKARELLGEQPDVLLGQARALSGTRERRSLNGRPAELIEQAVAKAPDNGQALWLGGLVAAERGDYATTEKRWQRLLAQQGPDSEIAGRIREGLSQIRARMDQPQGARTAAEAASDDTAAGGAAEAASVAVRVRLAPALEERAQPDDTVYVFARAVDGPPMPLAVIKRRVADLPAIVNLDSDDAMRPGRTIADQEQVAIVARVSKSGGARARPGDLQAAAQTLTLGEQSEVSLTIDSVVE